MAWTNFHSHTHYCDGTGTIAEYLENAVKQGMPSYGISSHAPVGFQTDWCIPDAEVKAYISELKAAKLKFLGQIQTYCGFEIDFIPGIAGRSRNLLKNLELDYFIGSIHFVGTFKNGEYWNIDHSKDLFIRGFQEIYNSNPKKLYSDFYELSLQMIEEDKPDILGHLDKVKMFNNRNEFFDESEKFYRDITQKVLDVIKKGGVIVEVNTRGYYRYGQDDLYPGYRILEQIAKMDIPVMLNSDSHKPEEISSGFEYAAKVLKEAGIKKLWTMLDNKWSEFNFNEQGLIIPG
ncbi:MAG: histidinol-phosphatase [Bacteroidales bacterium]|nr:histidinol-phosphatase [Bacteroidales bacterium]MBN2818192.1 histidinol-phosphatase [Bacteroidales bacterium]